MYRGVTAVIPEHAPLQIKVYAFLTIVMEIFYLNAVHTYEYILFA